MQSVPEHVTELAAEAPYVVICHHGARSQQVALFLERSGFAGIFNLQGGVDAWSRSVDPTIPLY